MEKLIEQIMRECEAEGEPVSREEAEEMARMELGAREVKHNAQADKPRKKSTRDRKVDTEKLEILELITKVLESEGYEPTIEKEVAIHFGNYSLKLTRHRPKN